MITFSMRWQTALQYKSELLSARSSQVHIILIGFGMWLEISPTGGLCPTQSRGIPVMVLKKSNKCSCYRCWCIILSLQLGHRRHVKGLSCLIGAVLRGDGRWSMFSPSSTPRFCYNLHNKVIFCHW